MSPTIATIATVRRAASSGVHLGERQGQHDAHVADSRLRRRDRAVLAELPAVDRVRLAVGRHRRERVAAVGGEVEHAAALGDVPGRWCRPPRRARRACPPPGPGTFRTTPGASSGSPGNPGGWSAIAAFARERRRGQAGVEARDRRGVEDGDVTTPTTALTATSSTATMTRRRRCRVQGRRRRAASDARHRASVSCVRAPSRDAAAWPGSPGRVIRRPSACSPRRARCGSSARGPRRSSCAGTRCRARPRTPCRRSRTTTRGRGSAPWTARGAGCA